MASDDGRFMFISLCVGGVCVCGWSVCVWVECVCGWSVCVCVWVECVWVGGVCVCVSDRYTHVNRLECLLHCLV